MTDCDYCSASFDDEDAYTAHLRAEHYEELGPIDRRRVGGGDDDDDGIDAAPVALGVVVLAAAAIVGYVVLVAGSGPDIGEPGSAHYHGTINVTVDGEEVDLSQDKYQFTDQRFHFENPNMEPPYRWHSHATGVTLGYGMEAIGIPVTDDSVTYEGTTYEDGDSGTTVVVQVNGDDVNPSNYVLEEGDTIRVVVRTS